MFIGTRKCLIKNFVSVYVSISSGNQDKSSWTGFRNSWRVVKKQPVLFRSPRRLLEWFFFFRLVLIAVDRASQVLGIPESPEGWLTGIESKTLSTKRDAAAGKKGCSSTSSIISSSKIFWLLSIILLLFCVLYASWILKCQLIVKRVCSGWCHVTCRYPLWGFRTKGNSSECYRRVQSCIANVGRSAWIRIIFYFITGWLIWPFFHPTYCRIQAS